jgi:gentisate 1,2-dioxygenase
LARLRCQRRHHSPQPHRRRRTEMGPPEMSFPRTRQGIARALRQPARRRPHPPAQSVRHAYPAPRTGRRGRPEISTVFASAAPGCSPRPSRELTGDQAWRVPPPPQPAAPRSAASSRLPSIR